MEKRTGERVIPHVVEPSYGIDRIIWTVLEHSFTRREGKGETKGDEESDGALNILRLPPLVAPITVGVFPLVSKDGLDVIAERLDGELRGAGLRTYHDVSGSIGRRYARADEAGVPFCITVDHQTMEDNSATVRWRDTQDQERLPLSHLVSSIKQLAGLD